MGTGEPNKFQFYFPIRQVQLSRGGKQGNNAFTYDTKMRKGGSIDFNKLIKLEPTVNVIKLLQQIKPDSISIPFLDRQGFRHSIGKIARTGNYDFLKYLVTKEPDGLGYGFNKLHSSSIL